MPIFPTITPAAIRSALRAGTEIALLDVRQESRFATGHPLFAASFPLGQLEEQAAERLPRRTVPVVVYGDSDSGDSGDSGDSDSDSDSDSGDDAAVAARRLRELGYTDVSLLAGGLASWTADGGELFEDVNAPSKAFGELVAETAGTPSLPAGEVAALLAGPSPAVVVDARRFDEYATMSIPTATSVPGAELALRVRALAPDPAVTVVVNCAGRTRSIIGTQSLINAGLPNRIVALRNGTIGWTLAGLDLDRGQARRAPDVSAETARQADADAWGVAGRTGVRRLDDGELRSLDDGKRTIYRFDVRTPPEYENGHRPGFRSAPGGQLVQETDWYAPVRGALIILADDRGGRAAMTASWLAQMGWDVAVATGSPAESAAAYAEASAAGHTAASAAGHTPTSAAGHSPGSAAGHTAGSADTAPGRPSAPDIPLADQETLADWLRDGEAAVVDLDTSRRFLAGHIPGAAWALRDELARPELLDRLGRPGRLVLTSPDGYLAAWAAADLNGTGGRTRVLALAGGTQEWARSGRPLESGQGTMLSPPLDVYRRPYEGTGIDPAVMQAYLDWEYGLVAQLGRDGTHGFWVLTG